MSDEQVREWIAAKARAVEIREWSVIGRTQSDYTATESRLQLVEMLVDLLGYIDLLEAGAVQNVRSLSAINERIGVMEKQSAQIEALIGKRQGAADE